MPLTFLLKCPVIYLVHKEKQIVKNHYYSEIFTTFNKNEVLICRLENAQFLCSFFQTVIVSFLQFYGSRKENCVVYD